MRRPMAKRHPQQLRLLPFWAHLDRSMQCKEQLVRRHRSVIHGRTSFLSSTLQQATAHTSISKNSLENATAIVEVRRTRQRLDSWNATSTMSTTMSFSPSTDPAPRTQTSRMTNRTRLKGIPLDISVRCPMGSLILILISTLFPLVQELFQQVLSLPCTKCMRPPCTLQRLSKRILGPLSFCVQLELLP